jgi:hypothetical protein
MSGVPGENVQARSWRLLERCVQMDSRKGDGSVRSCVRKGRSTQVLSWVFRAISVVAAYTLVLGACAAVPGAPSTSGEATPTVPSSSVASAVATSDAYATPFLEEHPGETLNPRCYGRSEAVDTPPYTIAFLMEYTTAVVVARVDSIEDGIFNTPGGVAPDRPPAEGYDPGVLTPVNLRVASVIEGNQGTRTMRVVNRGGQAGCITQQVSNAPQVETGVTYVFFLHPSVYSNGVHRPELPEMLVAWPVNDNGTVQTEEDGTLTVEELTDKVASSDR